MPSVYAFDLVEAWQAAREFNADYAAAYAEWNAGREKVVQGRAGLFPQVNLSSRYRRTIPSAPISGGHYDTRESAVTLSQPLFDISKWTGYQKGQLATQLADIQFTQYQQELLASVIQAYFDVLLAQDTLTATSASKNAYHHQLAQANLAFEVGSATRIDVNEAQASYDGAVAKEISDQSTLEYRRQHLSRLTGLDSTQLQPVHNPLLLASQAPLRRLPEWLDLAATQSPRLKVAEYAIAFATQDVMEKRGEHLPIVSLTAAYATHQYPGGFHDTQRERSVGIEMTLPLFSGGRITAQVREALSKKEAARHQWEAAQRHVQEDVRKAFLEVTSGAALIQARQNGVNSAKSKVISTTLGNKMGLRTRLDVLFAEQAYYDALSSLAVAKYQYLTAYAQLAQATGTLNDAQLAQINTVIQHRDTRNNLPEQGF